MYLTVEAKNYHATFQVPGRTGANLGHQVKWIEDIENL